jgi:hypothetical protein
MIGNKINFCDFNIYRKLILAYIQRWVQDHLEECFVVKNYFCQEVIIDNDKSTDGCSLCNESGIFLCKYIVCDTFLIYTDAIPASMIPCVAIAL